MHPDDNLGFLVTIIGWGRHQRLPVTFYNTFDLQEEFSSTWEVYQWLHDFDPQPSLSDILSGELPSALPAAPIVEESSSISDRRPVRACRNNTSAYRCKAVKEDTTTPIPIPNKPKIEMYVSFDGVPVPARTWKTAHMSDGQIRNVFKMTQSIFQGGVRIPNSDSEAESSPEWRQ